MSVEQQVVCPVKRHFTFFGVNVHRRRVYVAIVVGLAVWGLGELLHYAVLSHGAGFILIPVMDKILAVSEETI